MLRRVGGAGAGGSVCASVAGTVCSGFGSLRPRLWPQCGGSISGVALDSFSISWLHFLAVVLSALLGRGALGAVGIVRHAGHSVAGWGVISRLDISN